MNGLAYRSFIHGPSPEGIIVRSSGPAIQTLHSYALRHTAKWAHRRSRRQCCFRLAFQTPTGTLVLTPSTIRRINPVDARPKPSIYTVDQLPRSWHKAPRRDGYDDPCDRVVDTYKNYLPIENKLDLMIDRTAGVIKTMHIEGKINNAIGMSILIGAL